MPTNVPPEYTMAELRYRKAATPEEKLEALKEMMQLVPKHKGTEKLRVELKQRLKKLQDEAQKKAKTAPRGGPSYDHIEREGAGQVVLVGLPNSGKSSVLAAFTHAKPEIADFPYSTFVPTMGMMPLEDIQFQMIDLPPLSDFAEPWVYALIRQADLVAVVVDLSQPAPEEQVFEVLDFLEKARIRLWGKQRPADQPNGNLKRAVLVGNKLDIPGAREAAKTLHETYDTDYYVIPISAHSKENENAMKWRIFESLEIVRVYTKRPGHPPSKEHPYVLPKGSTVTDVARHIHYELAEKFKFARIWGSAQFEGQRVERDHVLADGDILEIHE
ncbi:TGS domain-containing protein [Candidatus Acetothermia bacterium]|nr:TGS domain-containing protein [Candidatus Acetothermia bacterium]